MKKILFSLCLFSTLATATTLKVQIHHIDFGVHNEPDLLMLSDGSVAVLPKTNKSALSDAESIQLRKETVKIILDKQHRVTSMTPLGESEKEIAFPQEEAKSSTYSPTVLPNLAEATTIFKNMRRDFQDESQCYNRAHVWAYEENRNHGTNLMKIFVFYTKRYIRNYHFYWWFHAIPAVYVGSDLVTLDRRYARGPLALKPWTDIFVRSNRACPVISKYSSYFQHQEAEDCYVHPATQYFWQPYDLDNLERRGSEKLQFIQSQVNHAYNEAF